MPNVVRAATLLLALGAPLPAEEVRAPDTVSFATEDGGTVVADLYGAGTRGVVLAHGGRYDRASWAPQAKRLAASGFRVLAIDFRGYGQSRAGTATTASDPGLRFDLVAAARWLRARGATSVAIVGGSLGGGAALEAAAAARPGEIDALALLAPAAVPHPESARGRKLVVTCRDDVMGDERRLRLPGIEAQFARLSEPKRLVVLDCAEHAQQVFAAPQGERAWREILAFLAASPSS
jgi:pimeloyl-ACP methyl ester carboxylesterase